MRNLVVNSSYDFDSTIALALVLHVHVWKHIDLCKVTNTNLFQRMEFESLSCSSSIIRYICMLVGIDIPSWIINRQWVVLFSACHHKRIPTCAVTDWYTHSNHCQRRLTNNIESLCSHLCTTPPAKLTPIYNPSCWIANLTIVHFLLIVIITYKHLTCTPSTDDLDTYLFTVHITSILLQFVRSTNTNSK